MVGSRDSFTFRQRKQGDTIDLSFSLLLSPERLDFGSEQGCSYIQVLIISET
jgi:hypothetical protein